MNQVALLLARRRRARAIRAYGVQALLWITVIAATLAVLAAA